jgi:hypothetical protein
MSENNVLELRFTNVKTSRLNFLYYNPDFISLFDPYQSIDYIHYGLRPKMTLDSLHGDFCVVFSATNLITTSWIAAFPDCHVVVVHKTPDYPYAIVETALSPVDSDSLATMEVIHRTFEDSEPLPTRENSEPFPTSEDLEPFPTSEIDY